jgi:KDO2-lipid IV(A) lauroyltransferase
MYYLLLLILYPLSLLPLGILYLLSDVTFFLLFFVFGYRKKVVWANLTHAFPEKEAAELKMIMRRFYHSFCDQWIETLKLLSMPMSALNKRVKGNWSVFEETCAAHQRVYALLGHQFNWEWGSVATQLNFNTQFAGIFLPQNSEAFNRLMLRIRRRSGAMLIPANDMRPSFVQLLRQDHMIGFMADQTPGSMKIADWYSFMNRPAPFFKGPEKQARRAGAAIVFVSLRKVKRGYYALLAQKICDNAAETPEGFITREYVSFLEKELHAQPENWMWTHRRWKKKPPPTVGD